MTDGVCAGYNGGEAPRLIVGIGVSAEDHRALQAFFTALPAESGLAVVVVHQVRDTAAIDDDRLISLLRRCTAMPVLEVADGMKVMADHAYVAPLRAVTALTAGILRLTAAEAAPRVPIDAFFGSLAQDQGGRAVGILLATSGTDGLLGLKTIASMGGMTMLSTRRPADDAPAKTVIDYRLPPAAMPAELLKYLDHLDTFAAANADISLQDELNSRFEEFGELLGAETGHDFKYYTTPILVRRIQRRMQVLRLAAVDDYLYRLRQERQERRALFHAMLIGASGFFRDPAAFTALSRKVIPRLLARPTGEPVRVWVPGCACGEEAYSLAILFREHMGQMETPLNVQILATDIDERALATARAGQYPEEVVKCLSSERLQRFFRQEGERFQVAQDIRELCLFSYHNLISDPPFSRLDLISCRNLLIYLGPPLQQKLMSVFHFALRPGGFLFLGPTESISTHKELFRAVDIRKRIAQRQQTAVPDAVASGPERIARVNQNRPLPPAAEDPDLGKIAQRILLDEFAPSYAIVTQAGEIVYLAAGIERYLQPSVGDFANHIVKMARTGLRSGLRAALNEANAKRRKVVREDLSVNTDKGVQPIRLIVQPMPELGKHGGLLMVVFQDFGAPRKRRRSSVPADSRALIAQLERELNSTREDLEQTVQQLETANAKLLSSNEELGEMNEELRAANEELEGVNEELQAANEKIEAAREDLQLSHSALERLNNDLENFLDSSQIATLFVDAELKIGRFTPAIIEIHPLLPSDIGRPLTHIAHRLQDMPPLPSLEELAGSAEPVRHEVQAVTGQWYLRQVAPYRDQNRRVAGLIISYTDITLMRTSEERQQRQLAELETLYRTAPVGLALFDADLRYQRLNERLATLDGVALAGHVGRTPREVVPDLADPIEAGLRQVLNTGEPVLNLEVEGYVPNIAEGKRFRLCSYHPLRGPAGTVEAISAVVLDITERKQMENWLRLFQSAVESANDAILITSAELDKPGPRIEYVNPAFERMSGYAADEILGRTPRLLQGPHTDRAVLERLRQDLMARGRFHGETINYRKDGSEFIVEWNVAAVRDESGTVAHWLAIQRDVTERRLTEQTLRNSEERLRIITDSIPSQIAYVDAEQRYRFVNAAYERRFNIPRSELVGRSVREVLGEVLYAAVKPHIEAALTGKSVTFENTFSGDDGHRGQTVLVSYTPDIDANERVLGFYVVVTDISVRKQAEQIMEEAARHKDAYLAMLAHELRNPLAPIHNAAQVLATLQFEDPQVSKLQEIIDRQVRHMARILDDLLDVSRIARGKIQLEKERLNLVDLVRRAADDFSGSAENAGLTVALAVPAGPLWVSADATRLAQVIGNLLQNALKFTEAGGGIKIAVTADEERNLAEIRVSDTGIGIPAALIGQVFEAFRQGDGGLNRGPKGLGLGLALVKGLVELHGGTVGVSSEGVGKGSEFTVCLPLSGPLSASSGILQATGSASGRQRILVVDDMRDTADTLQLILEHEGYEVAVAYDGEDCLAMARSFHPDIVLCDIELPTRDGYEVARALRADPQLRSAYLIAVTGYGREQDQEDASAAGFDSHLTKPVSREALRAALARGQSSLGSSLLPQ